MKRHLFAVTIALVALSLNSAPVAAQATGQTDVDITLPDIVILHYFSNVDLSITSNAMGNFLVGSGGDSSFNEGPAGPAAGGFTFDLNIGPSALTGDPSNALLVLENAWAVRSLSLAGGTNTQLVIAVTDGQLDHASGANILITGGAVDDGTSNGSTITFPATGLYNPRIGDVELNLDLTNATNAGDYSDGVFTLTATNV
jgi:hypothetical protein